MHRYRLGRSRDHGSYKSSEVMGLFIISIIGWSLFFGLCMSIGFIIDQVLSRLFRVGA